MSRMLADAVTALAAKPAGVVMRRGTVVDASTVEVQDGTLLTVALWCGDPLPGGPCALLSMGGSLLGLALGSDGGGPSGGDATYTHTQAVPATTWTVAHSMGKHPAVAVQDAAGTVIYGTVVHTSNNTLTVTFNAAVTGRADCN